MKILYGIQATGNGHVSRSREVIRHLKDLGHDVRVVLSGKDAERLKDVALFYPCDIFRGLTFSSFRGKLQYVKTAARLNLLQFFRDISNYDASSYDLVISDFEPLTSRIAARYKLSSIGIGHQYAFCFDIPVSGANPLSRWVLHSFAPVDIPIGLHWHHFNQPILPPIVPSGLHTGSPFDENKILVYLPFEHLDDIKAMLEPFDHMKFYVYGISGLNEKIDRGHTHLRPYSRNGFLADLADCSGVISNSGFELVSEALQMGKKILVKPLTGQFEQESNALAVTRLKLGVSMPGLCRRTVSQWLRLPAVPASGYPDVAGMIAKWIQDGGWQDIDDLAATAWDQTKNVPSLTP